MPIAAPIGEGKTYRRVWAWAWVVAMVEQAAATEVVQEMAAVREADQVQEVEVVRLEVDRPRG